MQQFAYEAAGVLAVVLLAALGWQWLITNNRRPCPKCDGTGDLPPGGKRTRPCNRCGGSGKVMTWSVRILRNVSTKARDKSEGLRK